MMSDRRRLDLYRRAILETVKKDDVVADLGTGLGVLAFFALQAGAKHVYAIERKTSIFLAQKISALNGFQDRLTFVRGNSMEIDLPEPVDCLISETLGSFGLDENSAQAMADLRRRFLKPGGRIIPLGVTTFFAPVSDFTFHRKLAVWREIEGVDFSPAMEEMRRRSFVFNVAPNSLMAEPQVFQQVGLLSEDTSVFERKMKFELSAEGPFTGFAGWFEARLTETVKLSTSPDSPATHWQQVFFSAAEPVGMKKGETVELHLRLEPAPDQSDETDVSYAIRYDGRIIS